MKNIKAHLGIVAIMTLLLSLGARSGLTARYDKDNHSQGDRSGHTKQNNFVGDAGVESDALYTFYQYRAQAEDFLLPNLEVSPDVDIDTFTFPGDVPAKLCAYNRLMVDGAAVRNKPTEIDSSSYASGTTTVNLKPANLPNTLAHVYLIASRDGSRLYGSGLIIARQYGSPGRVAIENALAAIGSADRTLIITRESTSWTVDDKLTFPGNVRLCIEKGGLLNISIPDVDIAGLTRANPCSVSWPGHGLSTGDIIRFEGITQADWTALKDQVYEITKTDNDHFTIPIDTSDYTADYLPETDPGTYTKLVVIKGKFNAGLYQIFSGIGLDKVVFDEGAVNEISVEWFGLSPGATASTNRAAIEAAIISAPVGGVVVIHSGTFKIANVQTYRSNVTLKNYGTWKLGNQVNNSMMRVGDETGSPAITRFVFKNYGILDGNRSHQTHATMYANDPDASVMRIFNATDCRVENYGEIKDFQYYGIMWNSSRRCTVDPVGYIHNGSNDALCAGNYSAIGNDCEKLQYRNGRIHNCGGGLDGATPWGPSIQLLGNYNIAENIVVTGFTAGGIAFGHSAYAPLGLSAGFCHYSIARNIICRNLTYDHVYGVAIKSGLSDYYLIDSCTFALDRSIVGSNDAKAIYCIDSRAGNGKGGTVTNCKITGFAYGIFSQEIKATGNKPNIQYITNNLFEDMTLPASIAIFLKNVYQHGVIITGNSTRNAGAAAGFYIDVPRTIIRGNNINIPSGPGFALRLGPNSGYSIIEGNILSGGSDYRIYSDGVPGSGNRTIINNDLGGGMIH